ncbi:TonB-dependent receptor [Pseudomonas sp. 148P]|uniref:TonB-dependent receptor n=1 Tax=Pseudomonas ulcerans TaxID=3115852 RepID=A0ABU7HNR9_9PSED|nr:MULTISPECIES: TonB-dependent receptor [unclassified Pseudomonas]MEE1923676.1 TonB-dependent receptor [Pseudomonas sp. 147P]MEE1933174.1 TonB-dependent receptor [Pseudomonas sp. 148P]
MRIKQHPFQRHPVASAIAVALLASALGAPTAMADDLPMAQASAAREASYQVAPGPLAPALRSLASSANVLLTFTAEQTDGKRTAGVNGRMDFPTALAAVLAGTGLQAVRLDTGAFVLQPVVADSTVSLAPTDVNARRAISGEAPAAYAGGQVASGSKVGVLGNKDLMDTPFSTVSYTQKKIQDEQARSVADVLFASDPSVRASIGASNRYDAFTIRGLRVANSDVALNGLFGLVPNWRIGVDSVERIELLKGPGAFLYGMAPAGGVGGNINLVTKRADEDLTRLTTTYSSSNIWGQRFDIGRRVGDEQQFGIRLNGSQSEGDAPYDGESVRSKDFSLGLDYAAERFRVSGDFIYQKDHTTAQERGYSLTPGIAVPSAPNPRTNLSQAYDFADSESTTGMLRGEFDLNGQITLFAAVGANRFNFEKREASGGTILNSAGDINVGTNALQNGQYETVTGEAGARFRFVTGVLSHEATLSVNALEQDYDLGQVTYANYRSNIYSPVTVPMRVTSSYGKGRASELSMHSTALADTIGWHDDLVQLTLGVREQYVDSKSYSGTTGLKTRGYSDSALSPTVGLVIRPSAELSLYANYIEGLTPGPTPPAAAVNSGDVFAPFKSRQYEAGAKLDLGNLGFGLSVFQIDVPNGFTDPLTHVYGLDGLQRNRGVELTSFGEITPQVRLLGGATFFDARQDKTAGDTNNGRFAVGVPRVQSTLGTEWDVPSLDGLTLTARAIYTGKTYLDSANQQVAPSWVRYDLGARYAFKVDKVPLTLRGTVQNVFDRQYWEANPSGYVGAGAPLTSWLSLTADF